MYVCFFAMLDISCPFILTQSLQVSDCMISILKKVFFVAENHDFHHGLQAFPSPTLNRKKPTKKVVRNEILTTPRLLGSVSLPSGSWCAIMFA